MNFDFIIKDLSILTFLMAFVVFGGWQIAKIITKKEFDAKLITTVNGAIAVLYAVIIGSILGGNFWQLIVSAAAVFASGSFYDLLKAYNAVK